MTKNILLCLLMLSFTSCFKTAEQIRREKLVDNMETQIDQSGILVAKLTQEVDDLQSKLNSFSGQIEELNHAQKMTLEERLNSMTLTIKSLEDQVEALKKDNEDNKKQIASLNQTVKRNQDYINKVNATLAGLNKSSGSSSQDTLSMAHQAFEKSKMDEAFDLYLQVIDSTKYNNAQKNHAYYNLGYIQYNKKKYDEALVYFSRIYTKYPKSNWAPLSLLYIGRSLKNIGKIKEGTEALQELIKNYPNSKQAASAKKEL